MTALDGAPSSAAVRGITEREFREVQQLVYSEAGIALGPTKQALVLSRLARRVRALDMPSIGEYVRHVREHRGDELTAMLDAITTNETHFFREPRHFELLEQRLVSLWRAEAEAGRRPRRVRVWSAACSTGEEPYSVAMLLLATLPQAEGWSLDIVATDLSTRVLDRATRAVWPIEQAAEIPPGLLRRYMLRGVNASRGVMKATPELRRAVRFTRLNLNDQHYAIGGPFDLILCRNVMIYFDLASKQRVVARLFDRLAPEGVLLLGHAETLTGITERGSAVAPTVYTHVHARESMAARLGFAVRGMSRRHRATT